MKRGLGFKISDCLGDEGFDSLRMRLFFIQVRFYGVLGKGFVKHRRFYGLFVKELLK